MRPSSREARDSKNTKHHARCAIEMDPSPATSSSSSSDASALPPALALVQSLAAKTERVRASVAELEAALRKKEGALAALRKEREEAEKASRRLNEYEAAGISAPYTRLCATAPPESAVTLVPEDPADSPLVVGVPETSPLSGARASVASLDAARSIAAFLRGAGFIPPSSTADIMSVLHVADDLQLDELSSAVRAFVLDAVS